MTRKDPEEKRKKRERKGAKIATEAVNQADATPSAGDVAPADDAQASPPEAAPANAANTARQRGLVTLAAVSGIALLGWGAFALLDADTQSTDDAYVAGNVVAITAREAGTVTAIHADNTQGVKAGDTLIELDSALADVNEDSAEAALARAVRQVRAESAHLGATGGEVAEAEASMTSARGDLIRRKAATASGAVPAEDLAHAQESLHHAEAALALAQGHRAEALAQVSGTAHNPAVLAAIAEMKRAAIARANMRIIAPLDGVVAQRNVQIGQHIAAGAPLMALVPLRSVWVEANFRETQLANIRIGQPVTLKADAWGGSVTFHGRVAGLSAGSGSAFALLPPQNASGNWIKVVQRLPVRIALDPAELDAHPLRIGLSISASIDTAQHAGAPVAAPAARALPETMPQAGMGAVDRRIAAIIAAASGGH